MRNVFTCLIAVVLPALLWAQSPEKMSYQAVIRDANDHLVTSETIGMQISILQGSVSGTAVYVERQTTTTNANGLVSLEVGTGITKADFSAIDWSNGPYFFKTETDPEGGDNYTITGTSQLLSVPYALHAKTAENFLNDQVDDADADPTNEIDVTTKSGLLVGDGSDISGLIGTTTGQVPKWDGSAWSLGNDETATGGSLWTATGKNTYYNAGNVGIGILAPDAKLHVKSSEKEVMRVENALDEVRLDFYNGSGYIGYVGSNWQSNIDFGTASDNTTGSVRLRTQNIPRFAIGPEGFVGIGVLTPKVQLDVDGGQWDVTNTEGDFRIGNAVNRLKIGVATGGGGAGIARIRAVGNTNQLRLGAGSSDVIIVDEDRIEINGEVNTPATGTANMVPIAYGNVEGIYHNATYDIVPVSSGTGNFSVGKGFRSSPNFYYVPGEYLITIDGVDYNSTDYVTVVTTRSGGNNQAWVTAGAHVDGKLMISFIGFDEDMEPEYKANNFYFVVYKP